MSDEIIKISPHFLTKGNDFSNLMVRGAWNDLVKFGLKPGYLNTLPNAQALYDRHNKYIKKNKGGTNVTKDFRKTGMFYNNKKRK
jgi:hypothetical protein